MKKIAYLFVILTAIVLLTSCGSEKFEVKFISDGNTVKTEEVEEGNKASSYQITKEGYDFEGWFLNDEAYDFDTLVTSNIVLTAKWTSKNEYVYNFYVDGKIYEALLLTEGDLEEKPTDPEKKGHTFIGWFVSGEEYNLENEVKSDLDLNARFKVNQYTYTFVNDDDTVLKKELVDFGSLITAPTVNPSKEEDEDYYYVFKGWDVSFRFVEEDVTIKAVYEAVLKVYYKVTFLNEDGTTFDEKTILNSETVEPLTLTKQSDVLYDYTLEGWYKDSSFEEKFDFSSFLEEDTTLYPKFYGSRKTLEGAKISFLGDSITTFYDKNAPATSMSSYYHGENEFYYPLYSSTIKTVEKTWWAQTMAQTSTVLGINNSWSGSTCYNFGSDSAASAAMNFSRINTLDENGAPDIVIIHIGTNDNVNGFTTDIFKTAYQTMIKRVKSVCPGAYIFVCTLGYSAYAGYSYKETTRLSYNSAIKDVAEEEGCTVIDLSRVITTSTYTTYLGDSLHYNDQGATAVANAVSNALKNFFAKKGD